MKNKMVFWICLVFIMLASIGFSYAFFATQFEGNETAKNISTFSSLLKLVYNDGSAEIALTDIEPGNTFNKTITVSNVGTETTYYALIWSNLINTFTNDEMIVSATCTSYSDYDNKTISGTCPSFNDVVIPYKEIATDTNIKKGITINTGIVHEYQFEIEFIETNELQNYNQNKTFNAKISVVESVACASTNLASNTLTYKILNDNCAEADNIASEFVSSSSGINFASSASDTNGKGVYFTSNLTRTEDANGDGTGDVVYYYRGDVNNNHIIFAGHCWKIVRINEDGSIKLRYNHIPVDNQCVSTKYTSLTVYNNTYGDNAYVGYMMGIDNQCTDSECDATILSTSYEEAHANIYDSYIKKDVDLWYETNILPLGSSVTSKIANTIYCNDRSLNSGDGYGRINTNYNAYRRLYSLKNPMYKCTLDNDKFTLKVDSGGVEGYGNNALKYPIALLTSDEAMYAGHIRNATTTNSYLVETYSYYFMSPAVHEYYDQYNNSTTVYRTTTRDSLLLGPVNNSGALVPALSLKGDVVISGGNGLKTSPYIVE